MLRRTIAICALVALAALSTIQIVQTQSNAGKTTLFEGARLIPGDGKPPIEGSAFLVENGAITRIGKKGEVQAPAGAAKVDLTGKTVMPTIINAHGHPAFQKGLTYAAENYTRQNIIDDMSRALYFGVAAVQSQGIERGEFAYQVRADQMAGKVGGARLLIAGRGIGAPNAGPGAAAYKGIAYEVTTPEEGRKSVQELAAKKVDAIKLWVDDRGGRAPRMAEPVFTAIIDEAHKHNLRATAHVFYHTDAVALVEAGVDGFAHMVRDKVMDDALIAAIVKKGVFPMGNMSGSQRNTYAELPPWLQESDPLMKMLREAAPPEVVQRMVSSYAKKDPEALARSRKGYAILEESMNRLGKAGAKVTMGADTGLEDHLFGLSEQRELEVMVKAGLTPMQGIVAATSNPAAYVKLDKMGTLAPGKDASFLVLDANPLDDITNTRRISSIYLKGGMVDRNALRANLTRGTN